MQIDVREQSLAQNMNAKTVNSFQVNVCAKLNGGDSFMWVFTVHYLSANTILAHTSRDKWKLSFRNTMTERQKNRKRMDVYVFVYIQERNKAKQFTIV